jgi:hypothetical protein
MLTVGKDDKVDCVTRESDSQGRWIVGMNHVYIYRAWPLIVVQNGKSKQFSHGEEEAFRVTSLEGATLAFSLY